jgi:NADH:ubiquinone oxidoreductase subunit 6 (subunit J)
MPTIVLAEIDSIGLGRIALPLVLGLAAIYLLLPRPRPYPPLWGAAAAGLALVLGGWLLISSGIAFPENVLFYAFSAIAIAGGALLVTQRNPVRAALSFALVVLSTCGLFLLQAAPFLMAATIIVYAGAIIVTFMFVIMLAQQSGRSDADDRSREPLLSCIAGIVLIGSLLYALGRDVDSKAPSFLATGYDPVAFDDLLARVRTASHQDSAGAIATTLRDSEAFQEFRQAAQASNGSWEGRDLSVALDNIRARWPSWKANGESDSMKRALDRLTVLGEALRGRYGPDVHPRMPRENVAALGGTLFTDYLIPVELGGTLLLVATVGAIAIAGRRTGELR